MRFHALPLSGAALIELEPHRDERGSFTRTFCRKEFEAHGLDPHIEQCNLSSNARRGTLRGLHFQRPPHLEAKLVHCVRGRIFDAIVDLRPDSASFGHSYTATLAAGGDKLLFVPAGFGHGFLTLEDDTEVHYQMSTAFVPGVGTGYRWDDPTFAIAWPEPPRIVSEQDRELPLFQPDRHRQEWQRSS